MGRSSVKVLVPGAGLGRLALEFASLGELHSCRTHWVQGDADAVTGRAGFAAQGNEFSAHMLIASNWVLNE